MAIRERDLVRVFLAVIAAILVGSAAFILSDRSARDERAQPVPEKRLPVTHMRGSADAPVAIVVYNDFECRYCKLLHQRIVPDLIRTYEDLISIEYRHFPLPRHPKALIEAEAAECIVQELGEDAFWDFADAMFGATPSDNRFEITRLPDLAVQVGADRTAFEACMRDGRGKNAVLAHMQDGIDRGIDTTPTTVIRGGGEEVRVERSYPGLITSGIDFILAHVANTANPHAGSNDGDEGLDEGL